MLGANLSPIEKMLEDIEGDIWVFGYGSLTWNPDFPYEENHVGFIKGFARKFWQGSTWHRGDKEKPGRVVTLVKEKESQVWGIAFRIDRKHINQALGKLNQREVKLGGYEIHHKTFYPCKQATQSTIIPVLIYVATPNNTLYVGQESIESLANRIAFAHGKSGPNVEYLFRLVDFMREHAPHANDEHLFHVDHLVRQKLGIPVDKVIPWKELKHSTFILNITLTI